MFFIGDGSGTWNDNPSAITSYFSESLFPVNTRVGSGSWTYVPNSAICERIQGGLHALPVAVFFRGPQCQSGRPVGSLRWSPDGLRHQHGRYEPGFFGFPRLSNPSGFTPVGRQLAQVRRAEPEYRDSRPHLVSAWANMPSSLAASTTTWKPFRAPPATPRAGSICNGSDCSTFNPATKLSALLSRITSLGNRRHRFQLSSWATRFGTFTRIISRLSSRTTTERPQDSPINIGVRYELGTVWADANNRLGNFDPNSPNGFVQVVLGSLLPTTPITAIGRPAWVSPGISSATRRR